jgi:UDP-N-acetylglucosamine:LPS N-acetylglucosamine transferase
VSGEPRKVLILSADIGEGHDGPARAIQREFSESEPEARVTIVNGLTAMGGVLTSIVRDGAEVSFKWFPWLFEIQYWLFMKVAPTRWFSQKLLTRIGSRPLMRIINAHTPDLIISTYPGVTVALGEMRLKGRLKIPTIAGITDLAGLYFWAHKGIDLHTVTHRESTETVERIAGTGSVRWALPPTSPAFLNPPTRAEARAELGLPAEGDVIIVSGGGWGVGDVTGGVATALARPGAQVVVLCGRNEVVKAALTEEFGGEDRLRIEGFTDRMATFLSAGDVLIHATGGLTALEAMICGTQVISYGFGVGHVRENNREYVHLGLAQVVKKRAELAGAIDRALEEPLPRDPRYAQLPSTADLSRELHRWVPPTPAWKLVGRRVLAGAVCLAAIGWLILGSGTGFNLFDGPLRLKAVSSIPTSQPVAGVIIDGPQGSLPATAAGLNARGIRASVAVTQPQSRQSLLSITAAGSEPIPHLRKSGAFRWLATRSRLKQLIRDLQLRKPFAYQPPSRGFSIGEYEAAKSLGGKPVKGAVTVASGSTIGALSRGEIIVVVITSDPRSLGALDELRRALVTNHLRAVPVSELLR